MIYCKSSSRPSFIQNEAHDIGFGRWNGRTSSINHGSALVVSKVGLEIMRESESISYIIKVNEVSHKLGGLLCWPPLLWVCGNKDKRAKLAFDMAPNVPHYFKGTFVEECPMLDIPDRHR